MSRCFMVLLVLLGNLLVVSNRQALYRLSTFRARA